MRAALAVPLRVPHGHPQLAGAAKLELEVARHHANHRVALAADADSPPHQGRVGAVAAGPKAVAQDDFAILTLGFFFWRKGAAQARLDYQHAKKARRHTHSRN